jgi:phosphoribosylaminoimidazole (AIR) synthetase
MQVGHEVWAAWTMLMAVSGDGVGERSMSSERRQMSQMASLSMDAVEHEVNDLLACRWRSRRRRSRRNA